MSADLHSADLDGLLLSDRRRLQTLLERIADREQRRRPVERERADFERRLAEARERRERRAASVPTLSYPPDLPVSAHAAALRDAIRGHQVLVVCGETGSGKTTQLPKLCLDVGRGLTGLIGHTQPRRIAARSVASRLAEELGVAVGAQVGFKVRFAASGGDDALIRVMTDGILLAEIHDDPDLLRYDTLIVDEAHERSLNIDFLLGYLSRLLPRRPELKLIITSATLDPERFARFFGGAPVIEVSGRGYPIETRYRPLGADEDDDLDPGLIPGVVDAVRELQSAPGGAGGDILVFLPGEREIRDAADALSQAFGPSLEILPLFSRLSWAEQQRVFQRAKGRRVVLATNVAETSLTVPGVRAVVDSGLARIGRYSARSKILRLPIEAVSRASADQRRGRCGRVGPGICIRLYAETDYEAREAFTPPEILRTNLASVILQMEVLGLGAVDEFPFVDPPDTRLVNDGYRLLQELEAVDEQRRRTTLGREIARLPVDPRLARMLAEAARFGAVAELLSLVAVLSIQDPRERPADRQAQADERHAAFADPRSEFLGLLQLWQAWQRVRAEKGSSQARRWCRDNFLSAARMREWEDLRAQLAEIATELGWRAGEKPATAEAIHRSLLPGLLGNVGEKTEKGDYQGARGLRFVIAPGSPLRQRPPKWLMAGSLAETHRVFARTCAAIQPAWIETAARHLVRRSYGEPEWSAERGFVAAIETVTLYGLTVAAGRRVNFGRIDPESARQIFVREALTHGHCRLRSRFLPHNQRVRERLEAAESRLRRRGVLVDEQRITEFYLARLPTSINGTRDLERWLQEDRRAREPLLQFAPADITAPGAPDPDDPQMPICLTLAGHNLPVKYVFLPGAPDDGATVEVPLALLPRLAEAETDWGIPGWRVERVTALIRGLPKPVRRLLVPAPDVAAACVAEITPAQGSLLEAAAAWLARRAAAPLTATDLRAVTVPAWLQLNLRVLDAAGVVLDEGRDLAPLKRRLAGAARAELARSGDAYTRRGLRDWDFGRLAESVEVERDGLRLTLYPALEDHGNAVDLVVVERSEQALAISNLGVRRLLALALDKPLSYARRALAADPELALLHQPLGPQRALVEDLCLRAVARCCLAEGDLPRDADAFRAAVERGRPDIHDEAVRLAGLTKEILAARREVARQLDALPGGVDPTLAADCRDQLEALVGVGFVAATPDPWLDSLPRYLRALARRVARLPGARHTAGDPQAALREWRSKSRALALDAERRGRAATPEVALLRWMTEEYCVSLFAQELRTAVPVSDKRLERQLVLAQAALSA